MKKFIALLICIVALVCAGVLCSVSGYAQTDVVFCDAKGKDTNKGTETAPVKTLEAAYKKLPEGGVIVLKSDITLKGTKEMPEHKGTVTITSKYNGTEYGGKLTNSAETFVKLNGSTVLSDVTVKSSKAITFVAQFNPIVFDDGFKVEYTGSASRKSDLRVVGGFYKPTEEQIDRLSTAGDATRRLYGDLTLNLNGGEDQDPGYKQRDRRRRGQHGRYGAREHHRLLQGRFSAPDG